MTDKLYPFSNTQIQLPSNISNKILELGKKVIIKSKIYDPKDHGLESNPHITILYGIHNVEPPMELVEFIETHPKFTITLGKISLFKGKDNDNPFDVVKVDVTSSDLYILNKEFRKICEFSSDYPEYIPHVTIAYVESGTHDHLEGINLLSGLSFVPDSVSFTAKKNNSNRLIFFGQR